MIYNSTFIFLIYNSAYIFLCIFVIYNLICDFDHYLGIYNSISYLLPLPNRLNESQSWLLSIFKPSTLFDNGHIFAG